MCKCHLLSCALLLKASFLVSQTGKAVLVEPLTIRFPELNWQVELPQGYLKVDISGTKEEQEYEERGIQRAFLARKGVDGYLWVLLTKLADSSVKAYDSILDHTQVSLSEAAASMPNMMTNLKVGKDSVGGEVFRKFTLVMHEKAAPWLAGALIKKEAMVACRHKGYEIWIQYDYTKDSIGEELISCFRRSHFKD